MTITVRNTKEALVVPPSLQRRAGFKAGDLLEIKASGGIITILPKAASAEDEYTPEQRRFVDARLAKGDEDIKRGRLYGPFDSADEMAASIEANIKKMRAAKRKAKRAR